MWVRPPLDDGSSEAPSNHACASALGGLDETLKMYAFCGNFVVSGQRKPVDIEAVESNMKEQPREFRRSVWSLTQRPVPRKRGDK